MNNQNSRSLGMAIINKLRDMGFRTQVILMTASGYHRVYCARLLYLQEKKIHHLIPLPFFLLLIFHTYCTLFLSFLTDHDL